MRHGSRIDPPNRFERVQSDWDWEHWENDPDHADEVFQRRIQYLPDSSRTLVTNNNSPDIPFTYSANPYRGCAHGCAYCYARPTHEYLGMNAGLDFETKIMVKHDAAKLLRAFLARKSWQPEPIVFCGVTDCYQPAERDFRLMRGCVEVAAEFRQPIGIITKNALVCRDADLLAPMAAQGLVHANISITTLDAALARDMEPRTSTPAARLKAIRLLSEAGIPVRAMIAPIIPGLNDSEIPALLEAVRTAGATDARYVLLRLPLTVEPVFLEWLRRTQPSKADKVEQLIRHTREGDLNRSEWGKRMSGTGRVAEQIRSLFQVFRTKLGFTDLPPYDCTKFRSNPGRPQQRTLFD